MTHHHLLLEPSCLLLLPNVSREKEGLLVPCPSKEKYNAKNTPHVSTSLMGNLTLGGTHDPFRGFPLVKTVFTIILRYYSPFSLCWYFNDGDGSRRISCQGNAKSGAPKIPLHPLGWLYSRRRIMECRRGQREIVTCIHCWWECKMTMQSLWKTSWEVPQKLKPSYHVTQQFHSQVCTKEKWKLCPQKNLYTDVPSRIISNSLKLGDEWNPKVWWTWYLEKQMGVLSIH